jgi:hypothetical protein
MRLLIIALLATGASPPAEARAEFQKVAGHRGANWGTVLFQDCRNREAASKAAYQRFSELWKNADADLPILKNVGTASEYR